MTILTSDLNQMIRDINQTLDAFATGYSFVLRSRCTGLPDHGHVWVGEAVALHHQGAPIATAPHDSPEAAVVEAREVIFRRLGRHAR